MASRFHLLVVLIIAICAAVAVSQQRTPTASGITEAMLKGHVRFLSDDMLEGRGTGARGGELAAKYIRPAREASVQSGR